MPTWQDAQQSPACRTGIGVPLDRVRVDANFKESQLRNVRTGQSVILLPELYGNHARFRGQVRDIGLIVWSVSTETALRGGFSLRGTSYFGRYPSFIDPSYKRWLKDGKRPNVWTPPT